MMAQVTSEPVPKVPYKRAEVHLLHEPHRELLVSATQGTMC